jgi:ankyrin repeat protein
MSPRKPNPLPPDQPGLDVMSQALHDGDPVVVRALLDAGGRVNYGRANGYDALIDAVHGRDVLRDPRLIELLELLVANNVPLNGISSYQESGLRVLSRLGRFDAVQLLLDAGADATHLRWTPLMHAVATGTAADVEQLLRDGAALEETDWWDRTAWLIALQSGDLAKCNLLRDHGANIHACGGRGRNPPLHYAIDNHHPHVLRWLIEIGLDIEQASDFGATSLIEAAEYGNLDCVEILLAAGASVEHVCNGSAALGHASSTAIVRQLLAACADPKDLTHEHRRRLLGLPADPDATLLQVSSEDFRRGRTRRYGCSNPERMEEPFWKGMIRAGINAYQAAQRCAGDSDESNSPDWCAERYGQSLTFLPDGRIVLVGGEHEDYYDPDFCIYNDVFVRELDGTFTIFGYSESVFPPTDFHTATLVGAHIYIIGSLGYHGTRRFGETPVYRLDTSTFAIERLNVTGESPGWIYGHRADLSAAREVRVSGGKIAALVDGEETHAENKRRFVLDLDRLAWRIAP